MMWANEQGRKGMAWEESAMGYGSLYLFYKPEDGAETVYRRIRVLNQKEGTFPAACCATN